MNVSQLEGEKALTVLADLLEPLSDILTDEDVVKVIRETDSKIKWVQVILKKKPKKVIEIMAILDEEDPETYKVNLLTLPVKLLSFFNDPAVSSLFTSQGQNKENVSSGSVQANIEA